MGEVTTDTGPIRRDIEVARADLGRALFVIGDRIAPKKVLERLKGTVRMKVAAKVEDLKAQLSPPRVVRRAIDSARGNDAHPARQEPIPIGTARVRELPPPARRPALETSRGADN